MKRLFFLSLFILAGATVFAQTGGTTPPPTQEKKVTPKKKGPKKDGFIYREESEADTVVPYAKVAKEDVAYTKRIWREIDLRDRGNAILASPKVNILGTIYKALAAGELDLYPAEDEDFQGEPLNQAKGNDPKATNSSAVDTAFLGVNPGTSEINRANNEFFAASFTTLRIKEDWILDIKRGIFEPRIVGIAPVRIDVKTQTDNNGNPVLDPTTNAPRADTLRTVAGWLYFDDLREILVKTKVANDNNDNSGINFDDVFTRRLFYSNIVKQSNAADNRIEDYLSNSKERLLEAERIKKIMADFEQGLWEY